MPKMTTDQQKQIQARNAKRDELIAQGYNPSHAARVARRDFPPLPKPKPEKKDQS